MKRRLFISSGSAAVALALTGCGGGGGGGGDSGAAAGGPTGPATPDLPLSSTPVSEVSYPFGARLNPYVAGILPTQNKSAMDGALKAHYDAWKASNVVAADSVVAGGYAVKFSHAGVLTVSEAMGYGMLLTVLFAGHDPQARTVFDGMLSVVRARPAFGSGQDALMDWRLLGSGASGGEGYSAMDGDLDIAMALLMADRQWGSNQKWNYKQEGIATINAMKAVHLKPDGTTKSLPSPNNNRTSDYMIGHFRAFKTATGDGIWDVAIDRAYEILDRMQTVYSPGVGLMPDFVINTHTATPSPSTGYIGDMNDKEGHFWWNACRNPLRFSSDYLLSGDARFAKVTGKMIDFFKSSSDGDPMNIGTGYALDGTKLSGGNSGAYHGPICAGACVDARFQGFLDAMWEWNVKHLTTGYYDGELQLLSLVVASGNWWTPGKA